jgi:hypothetical protein
VLWPVSERYLGTAHIWAYPAAMANGSASPVLSPVPIVPHRRRYLAASAVLLGTCASCASAIVYFYNLLHGHDLYPLGGNREQGVAALRTAVIASLVSLWAIWIGTRQEYRLAVVFLRTGLAVQVCLTLFALAGWQSPSWLGPIFPSTFFAEFNWLTFIFEVAPATAIAASLLLYLSFRWNPR